MEIGKKIVFVGSGNMARAIISGIISAGMISPTNVICNDIVKDKLDKLSHDFGISIAKDKRTALLGADIIFLSVKPQDIANVLTEITHFIQTGAIIISIAAGITTDLIEKYLDKKVAVIRAMPNTPAMVGSGATALCAGKYANSAQLQKAQFLFSAVGKVVIEDESNFDAITALSGSGPAYVFYLCELMAQAGQELGLKKEIAEAFAAQTVYGAGKMLVKSGASATELKQRVKSPKGTTEAALNYFEECKFKDIVLEAVRLAKIRSQQLRK
ncbi:MAG: pyrroline-5-carboxylate reductase [Elusimicrobiota bacterium]|jgi:pyrroline-5-carboxylate reductase|nr:pyrroline-5-carboxylate reductase [Elusimicrobiota bacterium]